MTFIVIEIAGMKAQGKAYINTIIFWPHDMSLGMKLFTSPILTPIEIIGKFTTSLPSASGKLVWDADDSAQAEGATTVRELNRALGLDLPTDGPKTLNGLILEQLQDIPEADVSIRIAGVAMEILHTQGRAVKSVRLFKPSQTLSAGREEP